MRRLWAERIPLQGGYIQFIDARHSFKGKERHTPYASIRHSSHESLRGAIRSYGMHDLDEFGKGDDRSNEDGLARHPQDEWLASK